MPEYNIGTKVTFRKNYSTKCSSRFDLPTYSPESNYRYELTPLHDDNLLRSGFVVGKRNVIMSDYMYHKGYKYHDGDSDYAYSEGTKEQVLLVAPSIRRKAFIVRYCDLVE